MQSLIKIPQIFIWGILILGFLLVIISLFYKKLSFVIGFCLFFLILGILRMQTSEFDIGNNKLSKLNGTGEVVISGVISDEPEIRDTTQRIKVQILDGTALITTNKYPTYKYLDKIKIIGKLETPSETEDFSYKNYLMKDGIYSVMGFPKIEVTGQEKTNITQKIYSSILFIKQKIRDNIQKNFSPPESLVLQGIILGDKTAIPKDLKNKFSVTGTSHIIAVSGTHIVILGAILMSFLFLIGLSRGQAFYVSIFFICFYIILVGLPSSGIRSGIMGILYLTGQNIGRQSTSSRIIFIACAIMLLQNPLLLLYDIGFQLSYLAVLGLIFFEPLMKNFLKFIAKKFFNIVVEERPEGFLSMISVTLAAQIFTLPIIIFNFGNISWVYPITNMLILPTVYYLMFFGFISVLVGMVSTALSWIISLPCYFLLLYFIWIVNVFSQPWMAKYIENISWVWLFVSYIIISGLIVFLNKKYKKSLL